MSVSKLFLWLGISFLSDFFPPCMSQSRTTGLESLGNICLPIPWQYFITIWELQVKCQCTVGFHFWERAVLFCIYDVCSSCSLTEFTKALQILGFRASNLARKQMLWICRFWSILLVPVTCYVVFATYKNSQFNLPVYQCIVSCVLEMRFSSRHFGITTECAHLQLLRKKPQSIWSSEF